LIVSTALSGTHTIPYALKNTKARSHEEDRGTWRHISQQAAGYSNK
jgi:hypothetical protein